MAVRPSPASDGESEPASEGDAHAPVVLPSLRVIRPGGGLHLSEAARQWWQYHELLLLLIWRDVQIRYKQTAIGVAWALLQPLLTMLVLSLLFGRLEGVADASPGVPYPVFVFLGVLSWLYFAQAVGSATESLLRNERLVTKVYFPRIFIPLASVLAALVDFLVAHLLLVPLLLFYQVLPSAAVLLWPLLVLALVLTAAAVGSLLAALAVSYRDVRYLVPFALQLGFFVTPTFYPLSLISWPWRALSAINPLAGIVELTRFCWLGTLAADASLLLWSLSAGLCLPLALGSWWAFSRLQRRFADVI